MATGRQGPTHARRTRPRGAGILGHGSDDLAAPLSVAARWATEGEALSFLATRPHAGEARWARAILIAAEPALRERVARGWGALTLHHPAAGYVAGVFTYPARAFVVWERGVELFDPEGLLEGDGRQVRTLTIASRDEPTAQALEAFLAQALALRG